jgi:hypothetical protein
VILLHSLARLRDRTLDATRDRRAVSKSLDAAIIRLSTAGELGPAAADGGKDSGGKSSKDSFDDGANSHEDVLSSLDARAQRALYVRATSSARDESVVQSPQPRELASSWPTQPPSAALRYGTPEAYRAVAAYGAQRELQAPVRRQDDKDDQGDKGDNANAPRIRMRA